MASLYLTDYAKNAVESKDSLKLGFVQAFREDPLMDKLPWTDTGDLKITFTRAKSMPQPSFRKLGNPYLSSKGDTRTVEDRIFHLGQNIDVDKALVKLKNQPVDRRTWEREMNLLAMKRTFRNYFINGNPATDEDGFTGLHYRLVNAHPASQSIDANGLDLTGDLSVNATRVKAITLLDELVDACNEGDCDALMMDRVTMMKYNSIFTFSGLDLTTEDHLGKKYKKYGNVLLVPMGYNRDETDEDPGTKVIGHDEAADGSALTGGDGCTSIYAAKFGKDQLGGAQEYAMDVKDMGLLNDGVTYRDVIDWPLGIYTVRPRCIARVYGITAQASGS
jgi:hypothetical protein